MEQYGFSKDWNSFFEEVDSYIDNRMTFEREYNSICRKAKSQSQVNPNSAACYYFMATLLCYYYYDNNENSESDQEWVIELGNKAIRYSRRLLSEDEEFKTMALVFELLALKHNRKNTQNLFLELQSIKRECPYIESIEGTLMKNEALRSWFDKAYYDIPFVMLIDCEVEDNLKLKAELAKELINSSNPIDKEIGYACLADALFDMGSYQEAERYAVLGKDLYGSLSEYNNDKNFYWGVCWSIYARCQEEKGNMDFAMVLIDKGATLGIPWCQKEKVRLEESGYYEND